MAHRTRSRALALAVLVVAAGCRAGDGGSSAAPARRDRSAPSTTAPAGAGRSGTEVSSAVLQGDDTRMRFAVRYPVVRGTPADAAVNAAVRAEAAAIRDAFVRLVDEVGVAPGGPPATLDGDYQVVRLDAAVASFRFLVSTYSGGAHPSNEVRTVNVDVRRGRRLTLADVFAPGSDWLHAVSTAAAGALREQLGADGDAAWIERGTAPDPQNFAAWAIGEDGLEITFQEYQVAAYALGSPTVTLDPAALGVEPAPPLAPR